MSPQPTLVIDDNEETGTKSASASTKLSFTAPLTNLAFPKDSKRSMLKSSLRAYEADPVKLTPGLDPTHLSKSSIAEPILNDTTSNDQPPRVRFASIDQVFQVSEDDQIIRRGIDQLHFTLPLNSPLLKLSSIPESSEQSINFNRLQTPPLGAQSAGVPMNSPYSRMCDQLEHFVDTETEATDNLLFNRPIIERNLSVDLSPELEKASVNPNFYKSLGINSYLQQQQQSNQQQQSFITPSNQLRNESRSLWLGNVDPTITEEEIRTAFEPFGLIENIRLLPAKECAFVNFFELESAIRGKNAMQGKPLGNMILKIGFGKISDPKEISGGGGLLPNAMPSSSFQLPSFASQGNQSRSVWIGNLGPEINCDMLMFHFNPFGPIESCRVLEAKNCAFVNYYSAEAAAIAKVKMNGAFIGNSIIKTGNAKDTSGTNMQAPQSNSINISNEPIISLMRTNKVEPTPSAPATFASITAVDLDDQDNQDSQNIDGNQMREFRRAIEASPEEIPSILKKLSKNCEFKELAIDSYGNILLQKMIERAQVQERLVILNALKGNITEIAKHKNGTWVIQKLITTAHDSSVVQRETIEELKNQIIDLLEDQFGNYVIQSILVTLPSDDKNLKIILEHIIQNSRKLALGKFSSRALKSILDASSLENQKILAQALAKESVLLSVDPNGAVVIQWILDSDLPGKISLITGHLQGRLAQVSLTKQGSVIIARIIGSSDEPKYRDSAILELYDLSTIESSTSIDKTSIFRGTDHLDSLLSEPSTCSILFKAYQVSKPTIRLRLAEKLRPKLMNLLIEILGEKDESKIEEEKIPVHLIRLYQELISKSH